MPSITIWVGWPPKTLIMAVIPDKQPDYIDQAGSTAFFDLKDGFRSPDFVDFYGSSPK